MFNFISCNNVAVAVV